MGWRREPARGLVSTPYGKCDSEADHIWRYVRQQWSWVTPHGPEAKVIYSRECRICSAYEHDVERPSRGTRVRWARQPLSQRELDEDALLRWKRAAGKA